MMANEVNEASARRISSKGRTHRSTKLLFGMLSALFIYFINFFLFSASEAIPNPNQRDEFKIILSAFLFSAATLKMFMELVYVLWSDFPLFKRTNRMFLMFRNCFWHFSTFRFPSRRSLSLSE